MTAQFVHFTGTKKIEGSEGMPDEPIDPATNAYYDCVGYAGAWYTYTGKTMTWDLRATRFGIVFESMVFPGSNRKITCPNEGARYASSEELAAAFWPVGGKPIAVEITSGYQEITTTMIDQINQIIELFQPGDLVVFC
jgi:hypothetical protein